MKTKSDLYREFFIAWGNALQDPANERVIIETDEYGLCAVLPVAQGQVSSVHFTDNIKVGERIHKGDELGYFLRLWQVASSDGSYCHGASPKSVARWASLMIEHGRATNIYNDVY